MLIWMREGPAVEARRTCGGADGLLLCWQEGTDNTLLHAAVLLARSCCVLRATE